MSSWDGLILVNAIEEDEIAYLKRRVCEETGLSADEVEIEIDQRGIVHAIARPKAKIESITFTLLFDGEGGAQE